jgi:hypothetical protein
MVCYKVISGAGPGIVIMYVIPATQEMEIGGSQFKTSPSKVSRLSENKRTEDIRP